MRYKTPTILQMELTECGAASLGMVLAYYGYYESLEKLRSLCGVSRNGSKASLIVQAAREYNLEASGYKVSTDDLDKLQNGPMILFWEFNHYVVYEGHSKNGKYYYINDPAEGPRVLDKETFDKSYTGVSLVFNPSKEFKTNNKSQSTLIALDKMLSGSKGLLTTIIWGGALLVFPGLVIPALMQTFIDYVLIDGTNWIASITLCFFVAIILQGLLTYIVDLALRRAEIQIGVNRTIQMIDYLFKLPLLFFNQRSNADIQNRIKLNSSVADTVFNVIADNALKFFTATFFLILMFSFSYKLTLLSIFLVLVQIFLLLIFTKKSQILSQSLRSLHIKMNNSFLNGLGAIKSLKASSREDYLFTKWMDNIALYNSKKLQFEVLKVYYNSIAQAIYIVGGVLIFIYGAFLVIDGDLSIGSLFAFQTLSTSFIAPIISLVLSSTQLQTMKADIQRINDVYSYKNDDIFKAEESQEEHLDIKDYASLELKNVSFKYGQSEPYILKDFSLKLSPGKSVAIVGASGSGKSTVAKIIAGILEPTDGEIFLNDIPYSQYTQRQFYNLVSIVNQSISMFSGSVADNLTLFSNHYSASDLQEAIKDASLTDELAKKGSILGQRVEEGGKNFSGGQRQRLELARVLSYNTPLIILDEATSALDTSIELQISLAIKRRKATSVIIAHRLSTIRDADEIIVLSNGSIAERGNHQELIKLGGVYAKMMKLEDKNNDL